METIKELGQNQVSRMLVIAASFVIVVAGMRSAQSILVPFLLSIFIAIVCGPALLWLRKKGLSAGLALVAVIIGVLGASVLLGTLVGTSIHDFSQSLPLYEEKLTEKTIALVNFLSGFGWKCLTILYLNMLIQVPLWG